MSLKSEILQGILSCCTPELIVLFNEKVTVEDHKLKSVKLCVVINCTNKKEIAKKLYLSVDVDIPFDLVIYTPDEWNNLILNHSSYASHIKTKGVVIYESHT